MLDTLPFVVQPAFQGRLFFQPATAGRTQEQLQGSARREGQAREALRFMFSPSGSMFREFLLGEQNPIAEPHPKLNPRPTLTQLRTLPPAWTLT
jgi:hypothetical protein